MAAIRYAARYRCDFCGKIADVPPPGDGAELAAPPPEGWLVYYCGTRQQLRIIVESVATADRFNDMCDECAWLPVVQLLDMLARRLGAPA